MYFSGVLLLDAKQLINETHAEVAGRSSASIQSVAHNYLLLRGTLHISADKIEIFADKRVQFYRRIFTPVFLL